MDAGHLEKRIHAIEFRVGKLSSQLRLVLLGLVGVIVVLVCAGAVAFGSLFTEVQQQKHATAQRAAMEQPLNDGQPPGPSAQPAADEDP